MIFLRRMRGDRVRPSMTEIVGSERETELLNSFRAWLVRLPKDAELFSSALTDETVSREVKIALAGGLNYLFKSLDLIDDGILGLGLLDDAFVLRLVLAQLGDAAPETLRELQGEADTAVEFLGGLAPRFARYLGSLTDARVRGRSAAEIVDDPEFMQEFVREVRSFAQRYECPDLPGETTALVKLRSFLGAKLPS